MPPEGSGELTEAEQSRVQTALSRMIIVHFVHNAPISSSRARRLSDRPHPSDAVAAALSWAWSERVCFFSFFFLLTGMHTLHFGTTSQQTTALFGATFD